MADKDARVRLNLAASGFSSSLQALQKQAKDFADAVDEIGENSEKTNRKAGGLFTTLKAGAAGAKSAVSELGTHLKSALGMAATLGGALSIGGALRGAQEVTESYKDLAFAIRTGTGAATTWQDVQKDVEGVSGKWKRSNKEVAESYAQIFQITGDKDFAKKSIGSVAEAATASGKPVSTLSEIAGTLNEKFGVMAGGVPKALATVLQLGNKGGASIEELGQKLGNVGASAKLLGMSGQKGLEDILSMLNMADDAIGPPRQKFAALGALLENLANPEKMKEVQKALNVQLVDSKGGIKTDALDRILAKTKGQQSELAKVFSGPELKLIGSLGQKFAEGFKGTSGSAQTKIAGGLDAFHKALAEGGKVTFDAGALQKEATGRLNDSGRNLQAALNDFQKVFERPEMVHAIDQVAAAAPKLAQTLGSIVEFVGNHPLLAAGGAVGATALKGALVGGATEAAGIFSKKVFERSATSAAGKIFAEAAFQPSWGTVLGGAFAIAAAAALAMAIGNAVQDKIEAADAGRRKTRADKLRTSLTAEYERTGHARPLTEAERLILTEGGAPGEEAPTGTDLGRDREKFQANQANRAALKAMGVDLGPGNENGDMGALQIKKLQDAGILPAPEGTAGQIVPKFSTSGISPMGAPGKDSLATAGSVLSGEHKTTIANADVLAAAVARQLGAATLNVRLIGGGGSGTNGLPGSAGNDSGSKPR